MIEINGVKYEKIIQEKEKVKSKPISKIALASMLFTLPYYDYNNFGGSNYIRKLPDIDLIKEFELIQQKKSYLSRWERDQVELIFNKYYKKVDNV